MSSQQSKEACNYLDQNTKEYACYIVYSKEQATLRLVHILTQPIILYFDYLFKRAKLNKKETKTTVGRRFQDELNHIPQFSTEERDQVVQELLDFAKIDKPEVIQTLLRTSMLTNGIIVGAFGTKDWKHPAQIDVPSVNAFVYRVLLLSGRSYFSQPIELIQTRRDLAQKVVKEAVEMSLNYFFPFEEIIRPLLDKFRNCDNTLKKHDFFEDILNRSAQMSNRDANSYLRQQLKYITNQDHEQDGEQNEVESKKAIDGKKKQSFMTDEDEEHNDQDEGEKGEEDDNAMDSITLKSKRSRPEETTSDEAEDEDEEENEEMNMQLETPSVQVTKKQRVKKQRNKRKNPEPRKEIEAYEDDGGYEDNLGFEDVD